MISRVCDSIKGIDYFFYRSNIRIHFLSFEYELIPEVIFIDLGYQLQLFFRTQMILFVQRAIHFLSKLKQEIANFFYILL